MKNQEKIIILNHEIRQQQEINTFQSNLNTHSNKKKLKKRKNCKTNSIDFSREKSN